MATIYAMLQDLKSWIKEVNASLAFIPFISF
jgi:hypothetical protein